MTRLDDFRTILLVAFVKKEDWRDGYDKCGREFVMVWKDEVDMAIEVAVDLCG
jgi:hypothetical protein